MDVDADGTLAAAPLEGSRLSRIETEIDIATAPHEVWRVLTDFAHYGDWNPFISKIEGEAKLGSKIKVFVSALGLPAMPLDAEVVRMEQDRALVWRSGLFAKGVFDRDHIIEVEPNATGCIVRQIQTFEGPMASAAAILGEGPVRHGLTRMNDALKRKVEQTGSN